MNLFQFVAIFLIRLFACWLGFTSLLGALYSVLGGFVWRGGFFSYYWEHWPAHPISLLVAWLLWRGSIPLGQRIGRDLGASASKHPDA
ncbi:MAG: hypothetical protein JO295_11715 [Verrucomicrobia bacterium]|nr:hypothetical protein [Verrucomicrobiota bacterium]